MSYSTQSEGAKLQVACRKALPQWWTLQGAKPEVETDSQSESDADARAQAQYSGPGSGAGIQVRQLVKRKAAVGCWLLAAGWKQAANCKLYELKFASKPGAK